LSDVKKQYVLANALDLHKQINSAAVAR
jgi:hypothetical protein